MSRLMISISGIRGVIGEGLEPHIIMELAQAFGTLCNKGPVVLGRDSRVSGEMLHNAAVAGLLSVGNTVIDLGIATTPTTQMATENLNAAGGLILTASHNPIMWNGLKMLTSDGLFLDAEQGEKVLKIWREKAFAIRTWDEIGTVRSYKNAAHEHIETVLALPYINVSQIRARKFKVVADCINGAGAVIVPKLLEALGCESMIINGTPDGRFSRTPEPLPENLGEVGEAIQQYGADFGIVVDPDSDRLALVSESGEPMGEEFTLALAVDFILSQKKGPVATNVSTSLVIDDIAEQHGCKVVRTRVGEINVAKRMHEIDAVIGGEGNGGVILPDVHLGRDAIVGIAITLQKLAETGHKLGELGNSFPQYSMVKRKIDLPADSDPAATIAALTERYKDEETDMTDGLKIIRPKSWVQVRASNTEPIIRIMSEAPTREEAEKLADELMQATEEAS